MKLARFAYQNKIYYGVVEGETIFPIETDSEEKPSSTNVTYPLKEVTLLVPCMPSKIVAVGLNYKDHAKELKMSIPDEPVIFIKPASSVIGPYDKIVYPKMSKQVDYEAELGVVIGKQAKDVSLEKAYQYILGYLCANDVTARDLQRKDIQWTRAKSFDTFSPIGPWIETDLNPLNLKIELKLNGEVRQSSSTSEMIFNPFELISFISKVMTLNVGDIIMTGTPHGVGSMEPGDIVEVEIEGIGTLKNQVIKQSNENKLT